MTALDLKRVHRFEWGACRAGALLVASFIIPFSGGERAITSMPFAAAFVLLVALLALCLPLVVASSPTTNVPIVYEIFLSTISSVALLVVVLRLIWHPGDGLDLGAALTALGALMTCIWSWKSVSRGG